MNKNLKIFKTILINICILFALVLTLELFFIARDKINNNSIITANDEKYIFYDSISKVNKKVAPNFIPRNHIDNLEFLPLSGISDYLVINCNENGYMATFNADRFGFNNIDSLYEFSEVDIVLIGDSFVQGQCVPQEKSISALLNSYGLRSLAYATGGAGPLQEYATYKEYTDYKKPKTVIWFFYEGNDIINLKRESSSKILENYYNNDSFSQDLISKQDQINTFWKSELKEVIRKRSNFINKILRSSHLMVRLKLYYNRLKSSFFYSSLEDKNYIDYFIELITKVKDDNVIKDRRFVFVYLPQIERYYKNIDILSVNKKELISKLNNNTISVFDFDSIVKNLKNPRSIYSSNEKHFNEYGYELLSQEVYKFLDTN